MKITTFQPVEVVTDVRCDICGQLTTSGEYSPQFGTLSAHWGYPSIHDDERYEVHLCEACFFDALRMLRDKRREQGLFSEDTEWPTDEFGLI